MLIAKQRTPCVAIIPLESATAARDLFDHLAGGRQTYWTDDAGVFPIDAESMSERLGFLYSSMRFFEKFSQRPECDCRFARDAQADMEQMKWL